MLFANPVFATIAVRNLGRSRRFYSEKLGLRLVEEQPGVLTFASGEMRLFVYQSEFAGTNKATSATWAVSTGIEALVKSLRDRGVVFEHYTHLPGLTLKGDLHVGSGMRVAWAKDPDGNILSFVSG